MHSSVQEALKEKGYTAKTLAQATGIKLATCYNLTRGRNKYISLRLARVIQSTIGLDLMPFLFDRSKHIRRRRWSKAARIRVRRSHAQKRAWAAKKENGHFSDGLVIIPTNGRACLVISANMKTVIGSGTILQKGSSL